MKIEREFPLRVYLNLGRRPDRRAGMAAALAGAGTDAVRMAAVDARWLKRRRGPERRATGGHDTAARYAVSLSRRMALRKAWRIGVPAVLVFEDDVVFAPDFAERVAALALPEDWGMFYFGCLHMTRPTRIGDGLVRVARAVDTHAFAVRSPYYRDVIRASAPWGHRGAGRLRNSDVLISDLHARIPTYAAFPNLAWQATQVVSDISGMANGNYDADGRQLCWGEVVSF